MADNEEETYFNDFGIFKGFSQALDLNEDDDDVLSYGANAYTHEPNSLPNKNRFCDNSSDYAGRRTLITNVDNKSMNSHQERLRGFGADEISLDDEDNYGAYSRAFYEPENRFLSVEREGEHPFSSSNTILSDKVTDENQEEMCFKPNLDFLEEDKTLKISLNDYEGVEKVVDTISKHSEDYEFTILQIECYQGQLSKENIQTILSASKGFKSIQLMDTTDSKIFATHKPVQNEMQRNLDEVTVNSFGIGSSPAKIDMTPKKDTHRHQKCKSMGGEDEFKEALTNQNAYKNHGINKTKQLKNSSRNTSLSQNEKGHKFT